MSLKKLLLWAFMASALVAGPVSAASVQALPDFTSIVKSEGAAVVNINTSHIERSANAGIPDALANDPFFEFFRRYAPPQMQEREVRSLGSGFIISPDGYVLTNAHVVANADSINVNLTDKRAFKARLIGLDTNTDVALLKIDGSNLPVVKLGKSADLQVGQWVLAIGSPFGFDNSVSQGIVSALGRQLPDENLVPFIQTDVPVNPGNSGGPLFNLAGQVVGINSQILSKSGGFMGISFSIPIDVAMEVANQLKAHGKVSRAKIGVTLQPLTEQLAQSFGLPNSNGVLIVQVEKGGPADKAGVRVGDIITGVNRQLVANGADLQRIIVMAKPGSHFTLQVWRNRASQDIGVTTEEWVAAKPDNGQATSKPDQQKMARIGLQVSELNAQQLKSLGLRYGLMVTNVSGLSARAGLVPGDVIIGIGGLPLTSLAQLQNAVKPERGNIALQIIRDGSQLLLALPLSK